MRGAGEVLVQLIQWSGRPVDLGRWAAAEPLLERYRLDFVIDAEVDVWEFIRTHILPILPLSIVSGPNGIAPVVWRYAPSTATPVHVLHPRQHTHNTRNHPPNHHTHIP